MTPYLKYLKAEKLLEYRGEARRITTKAANYQAMRGTLYRRGKSSLWLKCVGLEEASRIIKEIHHGVCGEHRWQIISSHRSITGQQ